MRRFTILIADDLAEAFDLYASEHGYNSRYEAFRDLIRGALYQQRIQKAAWSAQSAAASTDPADAHQLCHSADHAPPPGSVVALASEPRG